ncbi:MAG: hypothetical protein ACE14M_03295 [Terriglobales bacterium]
MALPIRIWGMDAYGRPFTQSATTVDISRQGARIKDLACELNPGEIVGIQHGTEKARFRVCWVSMARALQYPGQLGVNCIEPARCIWERELRQATQRTLSPMQSGPPVASAPPGSLSSVVPVAADVQSATQTFACKGTAEIRVVPTGAQHRGTLTRISALGCYIETFSPLPVQTNVELLLKTVDLELRCTASVRTSDAHFGMGLNFNRMMPDETARLGMILKRLSPVTPTRVGSAAPPRPLATAVSPAAAQTAAATPAPAPDLHAHCQKIIAELSQLESFLRTVPTGADPRLLTEFRASIEHARQSASIVQQWLELRSQARDPYPALTAMQEHRIHNANLLICDLLDELESSLKLPATRGMDRLIENLRQLARHVARISGDQAE